MGITQSTGALLRVLAIVLVIAAVYFFGDRAVKAIQAPAQLKAEQGTNKTFAAATKAQNAAVDGLKADSDARLAKSRAALENAGKGPEKRAKAILEAAPVGQSDYERAVNRVDRELGLK